MKKWKKKITEGDKSSSMLLQKQEEIQRKLMTNPIDNYLWM